MKKVYEYRSEVDGKIWVSTTEYDDTFIYAIGCLLVLLGFCIWSMTIHLMVIFSMLIGLFLGTWMSTGRTTVKPKDE